MNNKSSNAKIGRNVIQIESEALIALADRIGDDFNKAVEMVYERGGRVVVSGVGKSGLISQKIASTLASTGTPAQFIHPSEARHGDIGMVTSSDTALVVSNSGETYEILQLLPLFEQLGLPVIALVGRMDSTIGRKSELALDVSVEREACTLELAPTASTTATLAMGDAIAIALLEKRGFKEEDFALLHPAGSLGKKLLLTVNEIMHSGDDLPIVSVTTDVKSALLTMSEKRLGVAIVVGDDDRLIGIVTDGDIRRGIEKDDDLLNKTAESLVQSEEPRWVTSDTLAINALEIMEKHAITSLLVYENEKCDSAPDGLVHIHDILRIGVM
ncbi:MAG: D-arabinose 5-phosphate isomerase [Candidatus Marinimicrobia bacterium]|nr:D-arabinose 5-phosphate isomerase [Candidatus Neomarinimicrobiota bacterium]|tara:strand:+ start:4391 stop:5377 length:987 start_codon:yes stop_codon:yes gene_type:complete